MGGSGGARKPKHERGVVRKSSEDEARAKYLGRAMASQGVLRKDEPNGAITAC